MHLHVLFLEYVLLLCLRVLLDVTITQAAPYATVCKTHMWNLFAQECLRLFGRKSFFPQAKVLSLSLSPPIAGFGVELPNHKPKTQNLNP